MKDSDQHKFDALLEWAQSHGAALHPAVEIYNDDATKFSIRVRSDQQLDAGSTVVTCPTFITLSYLNALTNSPHSFSSRPAAGTSPSQPAAFPPRFMQEVPPHVIGRFFLIQQYLLGRDSFWYPYIATLPQPEHLSSWTLPAFWPAADVAFLSGTNADAAIEETRENVRREFKHAHKILKKEEHAGWEEYTRVLYNWAFCIFTSRSFRPSLILPEPTQQVLLGGGAGLLGEEEGVVGLEDFSMLQPVLDIANHDITKAVTWNNTTTTTRRQDISGCEMVTKDRYGPGQQVYNNYGNKTNSELLLGYGFILPVTEDGLHNDYIHVRKRVDQKEQERGGGKPKDFLIGLRPMHHPSSVVGRSRQLLLGENNAEGMRGFEHVEDGLILDLVLAVAVEEERGVIEGLLLAERQQEQQGQVGAISILEVTLTDWKEEDGKLGELRDRVKGALLTKLGNDFERLVQMDPEFAPATKNQELALQYREQCKRVYEAAIQALMKTYSDFGRAEVRQGIIIVN
ncbi:ribosomal lysine N-methyltransferase set10 [Diplogelasinospora grovesii]|uniref:Ribosomal lysine N-methyltransferase set10 n=1 Tax=Diplogelasinospora grovesii TaxID=303347 RepID=A0AAN6N1B9_9PEZI|nr:ribosomal lysine N-methyltransferase set10 [Diplogelasinospora grovesii]